MNKYEKKEWFKGYIRETWRNKIYALALIVLGIVSTLISKELTCLAFVLMGLVLFFMNENYIY